MSILVAQLAEAGSNASSPAALRMEDLPREAQLTVAAIAIGGPIVSLAVAWMLGVQRRNSIRGPERLGADESSWKLVWIFLMSFVVTTMSAGVLVHLLDNFPEEPRNILAGTLATVVGAVALVVFNAFMRTDGTLRLGLNLRRIPRAIVLAPLALIVILPWVQMTSIMLTLVLEHYGIDAPLEHDLFRVLREQGDWFKIWAVLSAVLIAPMTEELVFRGLLQTILRRWLGGPWPAIILASVIFAAVHNPWPIKLPIFVLSLGLGYAYERTGNLWLPICMHAMFNGMQFVLFTLMQR